MKQLDEIYRKKRWVVARSSNLPSTVQPLYGEITREGVDSVIQNFKEFQDPDTVFYDIGSGYGKMVLHVAVSCPIKKAVGVEYVSERCGYAKSSASKFQYKSEEEPEFIEADAFNLDYSDATVVYIDNTSVSWATLVNEILIPKLPKGCLLLMRNFRRTSGVMRGSIKASTTYVKDMKLHWGYIK